MQIDPIIRQIVGRVHVSTSNRQVIYTVISKLKRGKKTFKALPKEHKKLLMKQAIIVHAENYALYRDVMSGNLGGASRYNTADQPDNGS